MTSTPLCVSVLQLTSCGEIDRNLETLTQLLETAATQGAQLVVTPENTGLMAEDIHQLRACAFDEANHRLVQTVSATAKRLGLWVLIGSAPTRKTNGHIANRSFLLNAQGETTATYDKIHLFDVDLPTGERYRESERMEGGKTAVVASTPWGKLGLSICYDIRFPQLYREMAMAGAQMMAIPAAFTVPTGEAHWKTLVRARAIETGSFVFASGQVGQHDAHRATYGHSLIVDPWGKVLAEGGDTPTILTVTCDIAQSAHVRSRIPNLQHSPTYTLSCQG